MKLRHQLTAGFLLLVLIPVLFIVTALLRLERSQLDRQAAAELEGIRDGVEKSAAESLARADDSILLGRLRSELDRHPDLAWASVRWSRASGPQSAVVGTPSAGLRTRALSAYAQSADRGRAAMVELEVDEEARRQAIEAPLRRLRGELAVVLAAALILSLASARLLARYFTRRVDLLLEASRRIGEGRLEVRLEEEGSDELAALTRGFNHMAGRLAELERMKRDFVSSVTHELRSPLGAVQSFLSMLPLDVDEQGRLKNPERLKDYLQRIQGNVSRLTLFVNDLLDAAKIEAGKMSFSPAPAPLAPLILDVVRTFEARAAELGVALEAKAAPGLPDALADAERIRQVLVNLVSNALKFTRRGGRVEVRAELAQAAQGPALRVAVSDSGVGIPADKLPLLFRSFEQLEGQVRNSQLPKGTGLGLHIAQTIIIKHGGRIEVRSRPGEGTEFSFLLPLAGAAERGKIKEAS